MRARTLVLVVLLLSYGAVGARQPAVRMAVPLPAPAREIADALDLASIDRGQFVLQIVRTLSNAGSVDGEKPVRSRFLQLLTSSSGSGETVPLPLDASIWRESLLQRQVSNTQIIGAILSDRPSMLLYHGLAGLDDDTLAWLGAERDTLQFLMRRAGVFANFGPSIRVQGGRIAVPGGAEYEPLWQAIVGAEPGRPASFVRRLFNDQSGHLAWFFDAMSQLDENRLAFALGAGLPASSRIERVRALVDLFAAGARDWNLDQQPFNRRVLDPGLTLAIVEVAPGGAIVGPSQRGLWDRVFNDGGDGDLDGEDGGSAGEAVPLDAAWLLGRLHRVPVDAGRRRLETFLFGQRIFPSPASTDPAVGSVLRAFVAFPALMLTLERSGIRDPRTMTAAAIRARTLNDIGESHSRRVALTQYQALVGILERMTRTGGIAADRAEALVRSLSQVACGPRGYDGRMAGWIRQELLPSLRPVPAETLDELEDTLLAAMGGIGPGAAALPVVEWEGRRYHVSAARAETQRMRRVRQKQGGPTLGAALALADKAPETKGDQLLADTLASILYAAHLGDPDGPGVAMVNIALRHDLGTPGAFGSRGAWRLPAEAHGARGWHVTGSLLGLDVALARMALRRLDSSAMPPEPRLVSAERQTASLSVALSSPRLVSDVGRDEIAAALGRGRARLAALDGNRAAIEAVARDAGLSAWRREALAWTVANDRENLGAQLALLETMWLGKPRVSPALSLDGWGAATLPLNGCVCLAMPRAGPWEPLSGRPSLGLLATRGADVAILVAETLSALKLPAEIAPGVIAYTMQEVLDQARPSYFDDWREFGRAAAAVRRDTMIDFIAAQTAGGPLLPARAGSNRQP